MPRQRPITPPVTPGYTALPLPPPRPTDLRLMFNNINSIQSYSPAVLAATLESFLNMHPDILGMAETKKNWSRHADTIDPLLRTANRCMGHTAVRLVTSHCKDLPTIKYGIEQPGGVAQMVLRKVTGRVARRGQDTLGRWAWQELRLNGDSTMVIITAYRVNPERTAGPTTAYRQQWRALVRLGTHGQDPDPRTAFLADLSTFLTELRASRIQYILMMDANTAHDDDALLEFMHQQDMVDLMSEFLPLRRPNTHQRGTKQIDMIIGSTSLAHSVTAAHIMEFGSGPTSDHTVLTLDINFAALLGCDSMEGIDPTSPGNRTLRSTDVKASKRYLKYIRAQLEAHNLHHRVQTLTARCQRHGRCSDADERAFQRLDAHLSNILIDAERRCKRCLHRGRSPWSPMLVSAGHSVQAAEKELSRLRNGGLTSVPALDRANAISLAKQHVRTARQLITKARQNASVLRQSFLELRAQFEASRNNTSQAVTLKEILRRERLSKIYRKLGVHIGGKTFSPLDRVLVPDDPTNMENTTWTALLECQALWEALIQQGRDHFSQASDTPFATGPIAAAMGPFDQTELTTQILHGTFDTSQLATLVEVKDLIQALQYTDPQHPPTMDCALTVEDLKQTYAHIREDTASSPSGIHYGHYRTLIQDDVIFPTYASMTIFAFRWGIPPTRWLSAVQVLLEKDPGRPRIHRLRRIQLLEADMNASFRTLWGHRLLHKANSLGLISPWQFGIRQGRMCISAVLLKRLSYDSIRLMRQVATVFDNDMRACYDRLIPSQAMIPTRRAGLDIATANTMLRFIKNMKFYVRTAYGVSTQYFSSQPDCLILGMLQGSAAVGAVWALLWSMLFQCLEYLPKARFLSPRATVFSERHGEGFVDDTTLWEVDPSASLHTVVQRMQQKAQRWERVLWGAGGALNYEKCYTYLIDWTYTSTGIARMKTLAENQLSISLTTGDDATTTTMIQNVAPTDGRRTLGVRLAPDGSDTAEYQHRLQQANALVTRLNSAALMREEATIGFHSLWKPAIGYSLPTTCFSLDQCNSIQSRFMPTFAACMGLNRNTPNAIKYGPLRYGGLEIPSIWSEQGAGHTKMLVGHLRKQDEVGNLLKVTMDSLQLQAGVSWPILSRDGSLVRTYVDKSWVTHTWSFLDNHALTLQCDTRPWLRGQRAHDQFLMEAIADLPGISSSELRQVQRCRLYLCVTTLSDITNSSGTHIEEWAFNGHLPTDRTSIYRYPNQDRPSTTVWNTFRRLIRQCFTNGTPHTLQRRLGPWYRGRLTQSWNTVYDPQSREILIASGAVMRRYKQRSRMRYTYCGPKSEATFPRHTLPISGRMVGGHFETSSPSPCKLILAPPIPTAAPALKRMLRGLTLHLPLPTIATAIWNGDCRCATDGSVAHNLGTFGFALAVHIHDDDFTVAATAHGILPDLAEGIQMDSHRAEGGALYAALTWIHTLLQLHPAPPEITPSAVRLPIVLDNRSVTLDATDTMTDDTPVFNYLRPDFDLTSGIQRLIETIPIRVTIGWIKGHQDRTTPWADLGISARLNILADRECATAHTCDTNKTGLLPAWIPGTQAAICIGGTPVTKRTAKYVRTKAHEKALMEYTIHRSNNSLRDRTDIWTPEIFANIDWDAFEACFTSLTPGRRTRVAKFVHDWTPTLKQQSRFDNSLNNRCFNPDCNQLWEDANHIFQCRSATRLTKRQHCTQVFRQMLGKQYTPPDMSNAILQALDDWMEKRRVVPPRWTSHQTTPLRCDIRRAFDSQSAIGWDQFFRGRLTRDWRTPITTYYAERKPGRAFSPDSWMRGCIQNIWTFFNDMWDQRNADLHGGSPEATRAKALAATQATVRRIYTQSQNSVPDRTARVLHHIPIERILTWTKTHLDAYLATAEILLEQNVDPG